MIAKVNEQLINSLTDMLWVLRVDVKSGVSKEEPHSQASRNITTVMP